MSTNFYLVRHESSMGPEVSREHIGKRAAGWVFQFQGRNHSTFMAWNRRLGARGTYEAIIDEYGRTYTFAEFFAAVWATRAPWGTMRDEPAILPEDNDRNHTVKHDEGFPFCFYEFS